MYFSGTKPSDILLCIRRNDIRTYGKYLEDTNESIDLMEDLAHLHCYSRRTEVCVHV